MKKEQTNENERLRLLLSKTDYDSILQVLDDRDSKLYQKFKRSIDHGYLVKKSQAEKIHDKKKAATVNTIKVAILEIRNDNKKVNVMNIHKYSKLSRITITRHLKDNEGLINHGEQIDMFK